MNPAARQIRNFIVSLQLTVVLLALSIVLILTATLDQVNLGVWAVQHKYFRTFIVWKELGASSVPVFPGGYAIGGLLFINLIAAHIYRFKFTWQKSGIFLAHLGVMLLLVGELLSGLWQETFDMRLTEGQVVNYSESEFDQELAVIDVTNPEYDDVVVIPDKLLLRDQAIQSPSLPFRVVTKAFYSNATLSQRPSGAPAGSSLATAGVGPGIVAIPLAPTYKETERNTPAAYVEIVAPGGSLGTWLVSPDLGATQSFSFEGHTWKVALRVARRYHPFSLTLLEARHDVYPGTEIPKNFSSRVKLATPDGRDDREVLVFMNNPLRYAGLTFYQYQMNAANASSVLQVVRNPSWLLPYVSCALMGLGLVVQFGRHLFGFFRTRRAVALRSSGGVLPCSSRREARESGGARCSRSEPRELKQADQPSVEAESSQEISGLGRDS